MFSKQTRNSAVKMKESIEQNRLKNLLTDTITLLCKNGLSYAEECSVDALIGITLDKQDIILVSIKEILKSAIEKNNHSSDGEIGDTGSSNKRESDLTVKKKPHRKRSHTGDGRGSPENKYSKTFSQCDNSLPEECLSAITEASVETQSEAKLMQNTPEHDINIPLSVKTEKLELVDLEDNYDLIYIKQEHENKTNFVNASNSDGTNRTFHRSDLDANTTASTYLPTSHGAVDTGGVNLTHPPSLQLQQV